MSQKFKSDFLNILQERGFLYQATNLEELDTLCATQSIVAYNGYDPTGPSLHVGHLVSIMLLRHFQKCGHKPIVLMGGGTAQIGDPSGKDEMRNLIDDATIQANMDSIKGSFSPYIDFSDNKAIMVNNGDWLKDINYIEFLRDFGRHFSINRMLTLDSIKSRLDRQSPLSFLEFNYSLLQSYDFLKLYKEHNCILQLGGSDQWGNIVSGVDLVRRVEGKEVYGLTMPLITTSTGEKMGKTAKGQAIWLNADRFSPYDYWQYWRNTQDADVGRYLKLYTELPMDEIRRLETLQGQELNAAKIILADEATALLHGKESLDGIHKQVSALFNASNEDAVIIEISQNPLPIIDALIHPLLDKNALSSKGEARRLIQGNGVKINDQPVPNEQFVIDSSHHDDHGRIKLSIGKKKHIFIRLNG